MKKAVLIPDSFKGTMSSLEICSIMKKEILSRFPSCNVVSIPVADGGEGSCESFLQALGGKMVNVEVTGPFPNEKVMGYYAMLPDMTAVVETAAAASLPMVEDRKDPRNTTTYGVGELVLHAVQNGAKKVIVALGGSCTNDAACGLAAACGIRFYDSNDNAFIPVGGTLKDVARIDVSTLDDEVRNIPIVAMCDIDNPFYGESGAAYGYAPQKGADEECVKELDAGLMHIAEVMKRDLKMDVQNIPGAGAAGGMGGGIAAFFNAPLRMGMDVVLDCTGFDETAKDADYIFTGEGRIDSQSLRGKVVIGVSKRAKELKVPVIAVVGDIGDNIQGIYDEGVKAVFSINRVAVPYSVAKTRAKSDLALTMDNILRLL